MNNLGYEQFGSGAEMRGRGATSHNVRTAVAKIANKKACSSWQCRKYRDQILDCYNTQKTSEKLSVTDRGVTLLRIGIILKGVRDGSIYTRCHGIFVIEIRIV
jgi:hypothetical protein